MVSRPDRSDEFASGRSTNDTASLRLQLRLIHVDVIDPALMFSLPAEIFSAEEAMMRRGRTIQDYRTLRSTDSFVWSGSRGHDKAFKQNSGRRSVVELCINSMRIAYRSRKLI